MNDKNFLTYINKPMKKEDIFTIYKENDIKYEKCELYCDFVVSLILIVFDTYMGDELTNLENQVKHFNWCWDKNINNFKDEGLYFENDKLYDYFLEFTLEVFYNTPDKNELDFLDKKLVRLWKDIFDYNKNKTNSDVDSLVEIYKIFDKSLKI